MRPRRNLQFVKETPGEGALSENEARIILRDVVAGLKFYTHTDNSSWLETVEYFAFWGGQAKIADFGLAVRTESADDARNGQFVELRIIWHQKFWIRRITGVARIFGHLGVFCSPSWRGSLLLIARIYHKHLIKIETAGLPNSWSFIPAARDFDNGLLAGDPFESTHIWSNHLASIFQSRRDWSFEHETPFTLKQITKYGSIKLAQMEGVAVDFLDSQDILIVSGDGLRLDLIDKRTGY